MKAILLPRRHRPPGGPTSRRPNAGSNGAEAGISNDGAWSPKRVPGALRVEPDGSPHTELPALRSLFLVALDEHGLSAKRMHSFASYRHWQEQMARYGIELVKDARGHTAPFATERAHWASLRWRPHPRPQEGGTP